MYTGALPAQSNRATWNLTVTVTDDNGAAVDLTGATVTVGVREPESKLPRASYSSPSSQLTITDALNGVFSLAVDMDQATFPPGQYEVGAIIKLASGVKRTLIVATLPVVDGVVDAS